MAAPAPAGPPPPDFLSLIQRIPDLDGLDAFQQGIPQSLPNLLAPIQNVETHDGYLPTHEEIDRLLHRAFPGVCEVIVDGQIRSFHDDWQYIPHHPNGWDSFYRSLAQFFITKPYPFTVEPYRYQY
uniref:Uncharacterized protein n=1 Tax=Quercus lobata TaxID=97700 RepID=A0A7N2MXZ3_QUELO